MSKSFISYSHLNDDKRKILDNLLKKNRLTPIVVARRSKPAVLLATKVEDAIEESNYLIPILTEQSINNQWVNQEIGYANKLVKDKKIKIIPIVEKTLILDDRLKGFIHKQMDLPFVYENNDSNEIENSNFQIACNKLIQHLKGSPILVKYETDLRLKFTKLHVKNTNNEYYSNFSPNRKKIVKDDINIVTSVFIENLGRKTVTLVELQFELNVAYPIKNKFSLSDYRNRKIIFGLRSYRQTYNFSRYSIDLKHKPLIIKPNEIKNLFEAIFIIKSTIPDRFVKKIYTSIDENVDNFKEFDVNIVNIAGEIYKNKGKVL